MNNKLIYLARRADGISREDWPRAWKSHAIFAAKFPVAGARIEWLRYCNRVDQPMLDGKPVDLPMLSTAHDGVANLNYGQNEPSLSPLPDDIRKQFETDELRVFDMLVKNFAFPCTETPIRDGRPGKAALYLFLPRKTGISRDSFKTRLDGEHAALARKSIDAIAGLTRHAHNHPVQELPAPFAFDAIVEIWFETNDAAVRALSQGALDAILKDIANFCNMDDAAILLTQPCHAWPPDKALVHDPAA